MELNTDATEGLTKLGDATLILDNAFGILIEDSFEIALGLRSEKKLEGVAGGLVKQCSYGILTCIYESAKANVDNTELSSLLEDCKWTPDRIEFFLKKFQECHEEIRVELARIGGSYPHIVDVDWRLDYYVKSETNLDGNVSRIQHGNMAFKSLNG